MAIFEKKWSFAPAVVEHAPQEPGIYALWEGDELIYIGRSPSGGIQAALREHLAGHRGGCTALATHYSWEISLWPTLRESEVLAEFFNAHQRRPRCNEAA